MRQLKPMIILLLMLTSALAGCTGTDTSDQEQQIADLQQSNDEMNETINQQNQLNLELQIQLDEKTQMISTRETSILSYNANIVELESSISSLEEHRYLLSSSLNESSEFTDEILGVIEMMNNTMADLYISLVENSTLAQQLQIDLVAQQNLVTQWQQTAEDNRTNLSGVDLSGVELRGADLSGVYWYDTTCPDGTNSDNNGNTCVNNLVQYSDWLFIGDSDIEGWETSQFMDSSNIGEGGSMCSDILSSIDEILGQYVPIHVVIVCGENDLYEDRSVEETFEDFQDIINKIIESGASVTYMGTKPEPGTTELHAQYRDYDGRIQDFAVNLANDSYSPLNIVDVYQGFEDIGNPNSLYQEDELHLSLDGYGYWNQWLVQVSNDSTCIIWQRQECRVSVE
jgi:uncharacterized protein YjbI with pentapeptide repeats